MKPSIHYYNETAGLTENRYLNYINGEWKPSSTGAFIENINPATGEVLGEVTQSAAADVEEAVQAARAAQKSWRLVPAPERAEILYEVGRLLKERKEHLAQVLTSEMGKVIAEARGEVQEAIDMAYYMAGEGRRMFGDTTQAEMPNKFAMSIRVPVGVAGLITPWNFPIAIASWKSLPALVTGNAVIWKPANETPFMAYEFVHIYEEAGLPKGLINLVYGSGGEVGEAMVGHPDIDIISFTGSNEVGAAINEKAGRMLKRTSLEMGGKNAITVLEDADIDLAVDGILWSAYGTSGQRCTACSRIIVHKSVKEQLEEKLVERIAKLRIGNGLDESVDVGPVINRSALERIDEYVRIGVHEGARLLCGGRILGETDGISGGHYYAPTLFTDVTADMRIAQEEIFGPVTALISVKSLEEAIEVNNSVKFGLSSSIFTRDVNRVFPAMRDFDTGIVYVNAGTTGAEIHLPFGGTKGTGNGHRDSGVASLDVYTEWRSVYVDYSGKLQRAQIDNN
ncbi:aldehyde dehydrogenase family protein [Aneurinibacillus migulanus]|uniref:aldehyde dehydrogenase family protein n=1 Tax=Aneurinibacillus migulanus TaxID=47500 RepID=UPI00209EE2C1|nr:aldehyde dehydrogenase family protein [Aneurinibacillus migulanus]MCP1356831.1 aldehyde dehydrogenase family protein [Aneurinibacillus migulanus]